MKPARKPRRYKLPTKTWKHKERDLAALFGTVRRALSGSNSGGGSDDAHHPRIYLECKYSVRHKVWGIWRHAYNMAHRESRKQKRRVCVGLYEKGNASALLVIHEADLLAVAIEVLSQKMKAKDYPYSYHEAHILLQKFRVLARLP